MRGSPQPRTTGTDRIRIRTALPTQGERQRASGAAPSAVRPHYTGACLRSWRYVTREARLLPKFDPRAVGVARGLYPAARGRSHWQHRVRMSYTSARGELWRMGLQGKVADRHRGESGHRQGHRGRTRRRGSASGARGTACRRPHRGGADHSATQRCAGPPGRDGFKHVGWGARPSHGRRSGGLGTVDILVNNAGAIRPS